MKTKTIILRIALLFVIILGFSFLVTSCQLRMQRQAIAPPAPNSTFPVDDLKRPVQLQAPAQRVAIIGPGATETLFQLGLGDRVVGRDQVSDYPEATSKIPVVGDYTGPFFEKVIAVHPDLVIMQGETWDYARVEDFQQKIGVPVAALTANDLTAVSSDIRKMGAWLGQQPKADALADQLEKSTKAAPTPTMTAFIEVSRPPLWTAGKGTLVSDFIEHCGFRNVAKVAGYKQFSMESLLALNPDIYIVPADNPDPAKVLSSLRADPQLGKLPAVKAGRIIVINSDLSLRPGPRLIQGLAQLRAAALKFTKK